MFLTPIQMIIMILAIALGAEITRFLPFIIFPDNKEVPPVITYLGKLIPPAMIGFLVIFCIKNISVISYPYGIPEIASLATVFILQHLKGNTLLSIAIGTALYMFLVQSVFA